MAGMTCFAAPRYPVIVKSDDPVVLLRQHLLKRGLTQNERFRP